MVGIVCFLSSGHCSKGFQQCTGMMEGLMVWGSGASLQKSTPRSMASRRGDIYSSFSCSSLCMAHLQTFSIIFCNHF